MRGVSRVVGMNVERRKDYNTSSISKLLST